MLKPLSLAHALIASLLLVDFAPLSHAAASTDTNQGTQGSPNLFQEQPSSPRQSPQQLHNLLHTIQAGRMDLAAAVRLLDSAEHLQQQQQQQQQLPTNSSVPPGPAPQPEASATSSSNSTNSSSSDSRGILITAGHLQLLNAYITLALLYQYHNCSLPAEVVYYGQQELLQPAAAAIQALAQDTRADIKLVDGSVLLSQQLQATAAARQGQHPTHHQHQHHHLQQQQQEPGRAQRPPAADQDVLLGPHPLPPVTSFLTKVHALVYVTRFRHVLLLDSDNMPLSDPSHLLDHPDYSAAGNIFWSDFWYNKWMDPACYQLLGLEVPWEEDAAFRATESGQVVLDRQRHADVLCWVWLLNAHKDITWRCFYGDKDTYRMAFQLAGKPHLYRQLALHPHLALGQYPGQPYHHAGMVQPGLDGQLLFFHRTAAGKFWPQCAMRNGQGCTVDALTMAVDQTQLLASVEDPTNMTLAADKVDKQWQQQHCQEGQEAGPWVTPAAAAQDAAPVGAAAAAGTGACTAKGASEDPAAPPHHCSSSSSSESRKQLPPGPLHLLCNASASVGRQPIPVVEAPRLPLALMRVLERAHTVFVATPALLQRASQAGQPAATPEGGGRQGQGHQEL